MTSSCRGGRQGQNGRLSEVLNGRTKLQIVRPEVVSPLAYAVGLIHDKQTNCGLLQHRTEGAID